MCFINNDYISEEEPQRTRGILQMLKWTCNVTTTTTTTTDGDIDLTVSDGPARNIIVDSFNLLYEHLLPV